MKIGLMSFAHTHAAGYARLLAGLTGVEVLASDPLAAERPAHETGGAAFAAELGVDYVESYDQLFAWGPDGVVICSENARHRDDVERAAAAGVHVLCEKPLATTVEDGRAMIAACERAGVRLMIAYPVRHSPAYRSLRNAVAAGELGPLRALHGTNNGKVPYGARAWFVDPELAGGGGLIDHVVHLADLYDTLLGHIDAEEVYAAANALMPGADTGVETVGHVSIRYPNAIATIDSSWTVPQHAPTWGGLTLDAVGDLGFAAVDAFDQRVDGFSESAAGPVWLSFGADLDAAMVEAFLGVVRGDEPPTDGRAGFRSMAVALAALESTRTGRPAPVARLIG